MESEQHQVAPDVEVFKQDGAAVMLSAYWWRRPVVINFLRHFGCQFCREFVVALRRAYPDFVERGATVLAIAQGSPQQAAHFGMIYQVPFPVLADPRRQAYAAFGLGEGSWSQAINPAIAARMVGKALHGYLPGVSEHVNGLAGKDITLKQLGGTFIVDPAGRIRYVHVATPVYKLPTIAELLAALEP